MRRVVVGSCLVVAALFVGGRALHSQTPAPEVILVNAKVYTVDQAFSTAEAVAIANGKFTALGSTAQIRKLAGPSTRVIDVGGKTIIPGLQDNHLHNAGGGPGVEIGRAHV